MLHTNSFMKKTNNVPNELIYYDKYFNHITKISKSSDFDLGLLWINGECSDTFKDLTRLERMLLSLHYRGYTDREIGKELGYHKNTVYIKRLNIKNKLKKTLNK